MTSRTYLHFFVGMLFTLCVCYFQSAYLARLPWRWLQPDLISVVVVYFAVEHFFFSALGKILVAGVFLDATSAAPGGFYLMYGLFVLVLAHFFAKQVILHQRTGQLLLFAVLFLLKYVLLGFVLQEQFFIDEFLQAVLPHFLVTLIVVVPVFFMMSWFDERYFSRASLTPVLPDVGAASNGGGS